MVTVGHLMRIVFNSEHEPPQKTDHSTHELVGDCVVEAADSPGSMEVIYPHFPLEERISKTQGHDHDI